MKKSERQKRRSRVISEEAALWFVLATDNQQLPIADKLELIRWLRRSPEHIAELLLVAELEGRFNRHGHLLNEIQIQLDGNSSGSLLGADERYLSLSYLRDLKRQHSSSKVALVVVAVVAIVMSLVFHDVHGLGIAGISLSCLMLLSAKELVVTYRVSKGFFATTESEARDLIQFIVKNAEDIDFTDGSGKPRPCLVPEPPPPGAHAERGYAGVLSR